MTARKILVVDDEDRIQEVVQTCLEVLHSWQVSLAGSGPEGLLKAETEQPHAILLDVSMPEMDGLSTLQKLKENPATDRIPVILLTAKVQPKDQAQFTTLNIAGVITKPFDPLKIAAQIAEILDWSL